MKSFIRFSFIVLFLVFLARETESQLFTITKQPSSPVSVLEEQDLKLEWTFSVQRTFRRVQLSFSGEEIAFLEKSLTTIFLSAKFTGRLTASTTNTNATITLLNVSRTDSNDYVFAVLDTSGGSEKVPFQVVVQYPPSLIPSPDQVVLEGDPPITLNCIRDGEPAPNITWTKVLANGSDSDVLGTDEQFILPSNRTSDGTYRCKASNGIGSDVNHTINVTVNFKPERFIFTVKSSNENFCKGGIINITCSAFGKPVVHTYQLFRNDTLVHTSNNSVLVWSQETPAGGETVYTCVADNTVAMANTTRIVTINEGSVIEQLENVTAVEGMNTTLNCIVTGIPMPSVSWLEVQTGNHSSQNPFVFASVSRKQAGKYICHASNPCRNDSKSGILTVIYPPEGVQLQVSNDTVCKGANVILHCSAADANPMELTYHLYENNVMVSNSSSSSTGIWNRTMTTEGVFGYKCNVTNSVGTAMSSNVSVTVSVPPSIQPIDNEMIIEGGNLTLTCNASGFPAPTVYWVKTGTEDRFNERKLVFPTINRSEAGEYTCFASTPCNTSTELAVVDVQFKPEMVQLVPSETTVCQGEIMAFNCSANSNPAVHTYQLYVNGSMVNEVSSTGVWNITMTTGGVFVHKCKVNNTVGTAMSENITITVNVPPSIQPIDNEMVIEDGNVTLTCNASGFPTPTVYWVKTSNGVRFNKTELVFPNISRSEAGEYTCFASNPCNTATELADIDVQFKPEMVQLVPSKTTVCQGEITTFNCSANSNPAVRSYRLYVNGTMVVNEVSSTGVWNITMTTGGVFVYKCKVNNTVGTAMSENITITVNVPPSIRPIKNEMVIEGGSVTLTCNASGFPTPTVYWVKTSNGVRFNRTELVFPNISRSEAGEYTCFASNPCNTATELADIDVQYTPKITSISAAQTLNRGEVLNLNCVADGNPLPNITWTKISNGDIVNIPLTVTGKENEGDYRCTASNGIGSDTKDTSVTVNLPAVAVASADKNTVQKGGNVTLFCNASGTPTPSVIWTHVDTGNKHSNGTWIISDITFNDLGEYRCDAINIYGNDTNSTFILFKGGKCEEVCKDGRTCRSGLGTIPLCLCEEGKTGEKCEENESAENLFEAGLEFLMEFNDVYNDLENPETKKLTTKIEAAVKEELSDTGLTQVRVVSLRRGSVIADLELRFNRSIYQDSLRELLQDATKDNKLGDLKVNQVVVVGGFFATVESPTVKRAESCSMFFVGEKCDRASGALIALIVVGVIVVVGLLIGIVVCSLHKKNASGRGSFQNVKVSQRQDPEGNGSLPRDFVEPGGSSETVHGNENSGYDSEKPPESTQMVTFNSNNGQMQGIHLPDSRSQKAQPGEGTYADLGDFQPKPTAPATLPPIKKPPTYEETNYAEITQFLKAPVAPKQDEGPQEELALLEAPVEEPDENAKDDAWNNLNNDSAALSRETKEETNADKLYPSLELVKSENKTEQIVVSI